MPGSVAEYSSFKLLWDAARKEALTDDPSALRDPDEYLVRLRRKLSIGEEGFPRAFIDGLIVPAWQNGWVK